ncbi:MAG: cellulase, partial [Anaerolineae bacterium]|nr:cellulase [Phycisphaerae bacterium]
MKTLTLGVLVLITLLVGAIARAGETPAYTWRSVAVRGGGFVTAIVAHPRERDLFYARTDVGGAYRWDAPTKEWVALTDWIGMADANLTGCESVAVDLSDPNRVYLALGTYTNPRVGNGAIVRSNDRGKTFQRTDMPFKMGANEAGRGNGERLAVDPNDGNIIFFGSRDAGLWKSADGAATWKRVDAFPAIATENSSRANDRWNQPVGIVFVVFDPQQRGTIYAGVSTRETSFYRSTDAGNTWEAVPNQPTGLRPNHAAFAQDGMMYLSYGNDPGPNTMTDGAVRKFNTKDGTFTDISPVKPGGASKFGFGCVAVDASDPNTIMVTTFCRWNPGDDIFRSTDGGKTWKGTFASAQWDHSKAPWTAHAKPHWMSNVTIDPFDRDHVMFTTGYGIWACRNVGAVDSDKPTNWTFDDEGFEETVPIGLISPPEGAHLLSALGDIDGYRHDDLTVAQLQYTAPPRFSNSESIAFAENAPSVIARTGTIRERTPGQTRGAYSTDGGLTWTSFKSEPALPAGQTDGGFGQGSGLISVSSDGKTLVWNFRRGLAFFSRDNGTTWTASTGLNENVG